MASPLRVHVKNTFLAIDAGGEASPSREGAGRVAARRSKSCEQSRGLFAAEDASVKRHLQQLGEILNKGSSVCESSTEAVDSNDDEATDSSDACELGRAATPSRRLPLLPDDGVRESDAESKRLVAQRIGSKEVDPTAARRLAKLEEKQTRFAHSLVPRTVDLVKQYSREDASVTTIMARNIPSNYAQRDLMEDLAELGLNGTFDFLYIPLDKNTRTNVGYAFLNFIHSRYATECMRVLQGFRFKRNRRDRGRLAAASPAHIQGLEANLRHYEKAVVMTAKQKQRRPLVMLHGRASGSDSDGSVRLHKRSDSIASSTHGPISLERALCF